VQEMRARLKQAVMEGEAEYIAELKGPGQVIGAVSLEGQVGARPAWEARASGSPKGSAGCFRSKNLF
jgi:hypothetical protein